MIQRQLLVPVPAERLWEALTDAEAVAGWFGAQVEWDLRPGGRARFTRDDGPGRSGLVEIVRPGHQLVFRWWPDGEEAQASEVSYLLDPDGEGTRLTVTERPLVPGPDPAPAPPAQARAAVGGGSPASDRWSRWDTCLFRMWAACGPVPVSSGSRPGAGW